MPSEHLDSVDFGLADLVMNPDRVRATLDAEIAADQPEWFARYRHQLDDDWGVALAVFGINPELPD
ncbi:MAG: hypothetical protein ACR2LQ_02515 [Acidimicrobiales bacterium]